MITKEDLDKLETIYDKAGIFQEASVCAMVASEDYGYQRNKVAAVCLTFLTRLLKERKVRIIYED